MIKVSPNHARNRRSLYEAAGTDRYQEIMLTRKGLRAVARWVMSEGLLAQFSLAKEQIDLLEGRTSNDGDGDGDGDDGDETAEQEREKLLPDTDVRGIVVTEDFSQEKHTRKRIPHRSMMWSRQ